MDVILAVVVFGFITVAITSFALLDEPEIQSLEQRAQTIDVQLAASVAGCEAILNDAQVNDEAILCLTQADYNSLREELDVQGDFCIHLEDENGNVVPITNSSFSKLSIGSNEIKVGGVPCGS